MASPHAQLARSYDRLDAGLLTPSSELKVPLAGINLCDSAAVLTHEELRRLDQDLAAIVERRNRVLSGLSIRPAQRAEVDWMVKAHYLGKWPGVVVATLALCHDETPVGVIVFALPPSQTYKRYGGLTWELARLWVDDSEPRNTESWFIAKAVKWVKQNRPDVVALVSYADPSVGHAGTIYKASNWIADGRTDQERKTPRFDYEANGKRYSRRGHVPEGAEVHRIPRISKWRYYYRLTNA